MPAARVTEAGVRANIRVALAYLDSWLRGVGAAAIDNLMEDAATAEISRSQSVALWITRASTLDEGAAFDADRYAAHPRRGVDRLGGASTGRLAEAADLLDRLVLDDDFAEFLTLRAYASAGLMVPDWPHFYEATEGREPRPLLPRGLAAWGERAPGVGRRSRRR